MIAKTSQGVKNIFSIALLGKIETAGWSWIFSLGEEKKTSALFIYLFWMKDTVFQGQAKAWKLQPTVTAA